jgi:hydrogenase/urease accessory protein HupE
VAQVKVEQDGRLSLTLTHDALAFALGDTPAAVGDEPMYALLHGPDVDLSAAFEDGRERLASRMLITGDGQPISFQLREFPTLDKARTWQKEFPAERLPMKLEFVAAGVLSSGTKTLVLNFPEALGDVILSIERPGLEPLVLPVSPGQNSPGIDVSMASGSQDQAAPVSAASVAWRFTKLGFSHIIPNGADHCLFVLGLFLLIPRFKPVLWQISAFTVAHTVTLTLTSLHIIGLSSRVVEPTIAASIAFIGVENLVTKELHPWRPAVAFLFGLVHGMGVATEFNKAGFPPGQLVTSLAAFTVGVEGGHITVLLAAFATLAWFRDRPWYRSRVVVPLSLVIAGIAVVWMVQRLVP